MSEEKVRINPGAYALPEEMIDQRDFKASETVALREGELPKHFSLGDYIAETNYQNGWGSCTANATSHGLQILTVKNDKKPTNLPIVENMITILWQDLRTKMEHNLDDKNDSGDYVENAIEKAIKGVKADNNQLYKLKKYSYEQFFQNYETLEKMKRYIFSGNPIVMLIQGSRTTRNELTAGELKTFIPASARTGGHAITCVGWDEWGFWFLNSWSKNNKDKKKSVFHVSYENMLKTHGMWNWRYWVLFYETKIDTEYLKRKNNWILVMKALKKLYSEEDVVMQSVIETLSNGVRKNYPEINDELPVNS